MAGPGNGVGNGVALGIRGLTKAFGGLVVRAPYLMHGKTSQILHDGRTVFEGVENPFTATRYHSLIVDRASVPAALEVSATTSDGLVMGLRHREFICEGVQVGCFPDLYAALAGSPPDQVITI